MALYRYVKAQPKRPSLDRPIASGKKRRLKFLAPFFLVSGLFLLLNAALPIFLYQLRTKTNIQVLGEESILDYTKPSSWFPTAPRLPPRPSKITHYTLSIPKLKIKDAVVAIGGEDIRKSLIQYAGTALPGQYGNVVIFGHSALPQFFSPKNYKTIFSTLPTLEKGDEVLLNFDGILYRYRVIEMLEVSPTDVSVLAQYYDNRYLTLVTCVPPGTYLRRLIVRAELTD